MSRFSFDDIMNSKDSSFDSHQVPDRNEIEILESQQSMNKNISEAVNNETLSLPDGTVVVRPEEALIVLFVLVLWIGAIGLFFHRWGKIRNCEPYAPKFEAELHRSSCHDLLINKRMSMSSRAATTLQMSQNFDSFSKGNPIYNRSRQNSVFVSSRLITPPQVPRKTKSAMDLHSLINKRDCEDTKNERKT